MIKSTYWEFSLVDTEHLLYSVNDKLKAKNNVLENFF